MKAALVALVVFVLGMAIAWYGGAELAERSANNAALVILCLGFSAGAFCMAKAVGVDD